MKTYFHNGIVLTLIFLLSNISGAYAAGICVALAGTPACSMQARPATTKECCHRKKKQTDARGSTCMEASAPVCPLKYVVGKSLDVFIPASKVKQADVVSAGIVSPVYIIDRTWMDAAPITVIAPSPPLFITQQNLRI